MLDVPGLVAEKNKAFGKALILLLEIEYADATFFRWFQSAILGETITVEGEEWDAFGFSDPTLSQGSQGEIPAFEIGLTNAGQQVTSICENYLVEGRPGRIIVAHRDHLGDPTAMFSEGFIIQYVRTKGPNAAITCKAVPFNPLRTLVPRRIITRTEYPGLAGARSRYL